MSDERPGAGAGGSPDEKGASERKDEGAPESGDRQTPKSYGAILEEEIWQGLNELERPAGGLFLSGLSAGLDIGFSVFLMAAVLTALGGDPADPLTHFALANMYAVGFIFVILGRSELFTEHTTLAVFPVLGGRAGVGKLARLWGLVYASNVVGGAVFAAIMVAVGPSLGAMSEASFTAIAEELVRHGSFVIFTSAVLAGWLMGLLSWLLAAAQETISRIFFVWLIATGIGYLGLHHCIVGTVEVLGGVFASETLGMAEFGRFLLWTTVGNAAGGAFFVGLVKYSHAVKGPTFPKRNF